MDIDKAKNLVNEDEAKAKNKTLLALAAVVVLIIVAIVVFFPKGKDKEEKAQEMAQVTDVQKVPTFFEPEQRGGPKRSNPDDLFEKDSQIPKEQRQKMLEMAEAYGGEFEPEEDQEAMENERLREELRKIKNKKTGPAIPSGPPAEYQLSYAHRKRLSKDYQAAVSHYRTAKNAGWVMPQNKYDGAVGAGSELAKVEAPLKDLYKGATSAGSSYSLKLGPGTRIMAVTDQEVNSDYPGMFTAKVVRPFELKGAKLICESGANVRDRIPVRVTKMTHEGYEYSFNGQVEMKYPGMAGKVRNNWYKRLGPELINTAIGAGFLAWTVNNSSGQDRIDTRDAIAAPVIEGSIGGLQDEISRLGGDVPNTVIVPAGAQFKILLSEKLEVSL